MGAQHRVARSVVAVLVVVGVAGCGGDPQDSAPTTSSSSPAESPTPRCLRTDGNCLGVLAKGSYSSASFAAFGSAGPEQLAYSVTDDTWANALDHEAGYWFQEAEAYAGSNGDSTLEGVYVFADAAAAKQVYPDCTEESDPSVKTDAASLLAWIGTLPDLRTSPAPDLATASGVAPGLRITVKPGTYGNCYDGATVRTFVASRPGALDPYVWGITGTEAIEAHFLDIGDGHTAAILLYAPSGKLTPRFVHRARDLAASFAFHSPAA